MQAFLTLDELYRPVQTEMDQVRAQASALWREALALVHGSDLEAPRAGGKLLRPALCLLAAGATGAPDRARFVKMAAAMEMLHLASLAHDDVLDEADMRRGERSLKARWTNHMAVLGGDYLVARSIGVLAEYDSCGVIANAVGSVRDMAEGELVNFGKGPGYFESDGCLRLAQKKTASLFAVACSSPTYLTDPNLREAVHGYGMNFGIAFQLIDDVLDLCQSEEALGKPSCGDLVEGKKTIPILYMREYMSPGEAARLDAMAGQDLTPLERDWVVQAMETTGARARTVELARQYSDDARTFLDALPDSPYRDAMHSMAEFILVRNS